MPVTINDLSAPTSGQFFRLNAPLTNADVNGIFDDAVHNATGPEEPRGIRTQLALNNINYWASFLCFANQAAPSFLPNTVLREKRYAFMLLIEMRYSSKWYLGVFRSGISSAGETLEDLATPISRRALTRAFGEKAIYEKLSLRRMTVSENELRASSYEAANLAFTLPSLAVTRSVPRQLRLQNREQGTISITTGTSRIHKSGPRTGVNGLAQIVRAVARETGKSVANPFLDPFPTSVEFDDKPKNARPVGLLFDWPRLLADDQLELKWITQANELKPIKPKVFLRMIGGVLVTKKDHDTWIVTRQKGVALGRLRANKRGYAVPELLNQRVSVVDAQDHQITKPLTTWVRKQQAFQIAFSSPEYFYTGGYLYKRAAFDQDIQLVRDIMQTFAALSNVDSEKGDPEPASQADTQFPVGSIFRFVEDVAFSQSEFLWCDDNGDEWADYIALRNGRIAFIHCKHGEHTSGAGDYQIVVAQALKNLGRVQATPAEFATKMATAAATPMWKHTGITELRKGNSLADFEKMTLQRVRDPDIRREVHLVISMLSLAHCALVRVGVCVHRERHACAVRFAVTTNGHEFTRIFDSEKRSCLRQDGESRGYGAI
jgi:hypothetical protein